MIPGSTRLKSRLASVVVAIATVPAIARASPAPLPHVAVGRIVRLEETSRFVPPHTVDVWLPPNYPAQAPYAVLYMFDGQMLFDATRTWNHQSWRAADTAAALIRSGRTRPFIIVGIWNAGARRESEYYPQKAWLALEEAQRDRVRHMDLMLPVDPYSDAYLRFLVEELKPRIDERFRVATDPADTVVMGSSMGGLMAWYAMAEYPTVFSGAGCLSTHWPGTALEPRRRNPSPDAFVAYLKTHAPAAADHRIYFDHGTATLDAMYARTQERVDRLFRARGYTVRNFRSQVFPGAAHTEDAWAARLDEPMRFLLPPREPDHPPRAGYVPTADAATAIAVAVWIPRYGAKTIAREKPYVAELKDGVWIVHGSLPPGAIGGVAEARISAADGRILGVTHGQ